MFFDIFFSNLPFASLIAFVQCILVTGIVSFSFVQLISIPTSSLHSFNHYASVDAKIMLTDAKSQLLEHFEREKCMLPSGARWPSGLERWLGPATGRFPGRVRIPLR